MSVDRNNAWDRTIRIDAYNAWTLGVLIKGDQTRVLHIYSVFLDFGSGRYSPIGMRGEIKIFTKELCLDYYAIGCKAGWHPVSGLVLLGVSPLTHSRFVSESRMTISSFIVIDEAVADFK